MNGMCGVHYSQTVHSFTTPIDNGLRLGQFSDSRVGETSVSFHNRGGCQGQPLVETNVLEFFCILRVRKPNDHVEETRNDHSPELKISRNLRVVLPVFST